MIFEDLRAFVAVANEGSFSQAAAALCTAQSALSKRIQRLEARLGTPLFERTARGVLLTPSGVTFLTRARRLVQEVDEMERNLSAYAQTPSGDVILALPPRTSGVLAPAVLERCWSELPLVQLKVMEGTPSEVHGWLMQGDADIAMTYNEDLGSGFRVQPVLSEPLFLFATPELVSQLFEEGLTTDALGFPDLARVPLILPHRPNVVRVLVDRLCAGHGVRPRIIYETDGSMTLLGMVTKGMGATIFSMSTYWSVLVQAGKLVAIPFSSPLVNWKMFLVCTHRDQESIAIRRVYEIVTQEIDRLINNGAWKHARRMGV